MATAPRTQQAQFLQRRLARRAGASSITRLADQYQGQIQSLTSQYETEFSRYQQQVNEMMRPYEEAMQRYSSEQMPAYEQAVTGFNERLSAWQTQAEIAQRPPEAFGRRVREYGNAPGLYYLQDVTDNYRNYEDFQRRFAAIAPEARAFGLNVNNAGWVTITDNDFYYYEPDRYGQAGGSWGTIYRRQGLPPGEFTEQQPVAPEAPTAPKIDDFDQSGFDQRRTQLQEGFQRDIAARKGARLSAARRSSRTLLSGAQ
jgi:hypothetical protein